ncbi:MAG TPA: SDR family NAD(P)-dependent oxidoreductase [Ktedonobacteraceae bacterium]|nr:SDR family NAD(P)-dependent oxidoreductase [Ktedonobacteraceae bacterium]
MRNLTGKTVLVTGVTGGIGPSIVRELAKEQMKLVLAARIASKLEEVAAQLRQEGHQVLAIPTDVTDHKAVQTLVAKAQQEFGGIDVLVNNAGVATLGAYHELPWEVVDNILQVNLMAPMLLTHLVLPMMLAQRRGHIVNIASLAGKAGVAYEEAYCATKAGMIMFTSALRASYRENGVSASVICPGFIKQAGMFQRVVDSTRVSIPPMFGSYPPQKVALAVLRAIKRDLPEVIVNPTPVKPFMVLQVLSPGPAERLFPLMGSDVFKRAAQVRESEATSSPLRHEI